MVPSTCARFRSRRPRTAIARVLLPDPLCPTRPSISPCRISNTTSRSTAGFPAYRTEKFAASRTSVCEAPVAILRVPLCPFVVVLCVWRDQLLRAHRQALRIPKCLRMQNDRARPLHRGRNGRQCVLIDQKNERRLLHNNFLHPVKTFLALPGITGRGLSPHQPVNLGFPCGLWSFLLWIPLMVLRRTQPHVHLTVRIHIHIGEPQQDRFVVEGLRHALDERREVKRHDVYMDANLLQVFLDQHCHALAILIPGICDDRKHHSVSVTILQHAVLQTKSLSLQRFQGSVRTVCFRPQLDVEPEFVGRGKWTSRRLCMSVKNYAAQIRAVDRGGNGSPEIRRPKPVFLVPGNGSLCHLVKPHLLAV